MELTNLHILRLNKGKLLAINLHHILSTLMMDDPEIITNFLINTLGINTQKTIDLITNFVESFGVLLPVNDGDIDTFIKDAHSANNFRVAAQRILIINNITQGLKSMFLEPKDR